MRLCYKKMLNKNYEQKKASQQKKQQNRSVYKIPPKKKQKVQDLKTLAQPLWTTSLTYPPLAQPPLTP